MPRSAAREIKGASVAEACDHLPVGTVGQLGLPEGPAIDWSIRDGNGRGGGGLVPPADGRPAQVSEAQADVAAGKVFTLVPVIAGFI